MDMKKCQSRQSSLRGVLEHPEPYRGHAPGVCARVCVFVHVCVCVVYTCRVQREVVSLYVYKEEGDWLQLSRLYRRYDSINTLVMRCATATCSIPVGDHEVLTYLRYPVHSSQYYKQQSSHRV